MREYPDIQLRWFIERATSTSSPTTSVVAIYGDKTIVKAITFGGHEQTYQAWNGVDSETMASDRQFQLLWCHLRRSGKHRTRYYDNEIDDYGQDHYQCT